MAISSPIDTSNKVPGAYLQVTLGVGPRNPGSAPMKILLVANKLSAGTLALNTATPLYSPDEAKTYGGAGSEAHRMAMAIFDAYPSASVTLLLVAESAGTAASLNTVVFGGGPATSAGTVEIWIGPERIVASVAIGDTVTNIGDAVAAAINDGTSLPVTASNGAGTVTITAKQKGPRGNFIRVRSKLTGATAVTHTAIAAYLAGGTTSDDPTTALDTVDPERFNLIACPYSDSTNLGYFKTHVNDAAEPEVGLRQHFVFGSLDTLANTVTLSDAVNSARAFLAWHYNSLQTPGELAAALAGKMARELTSDRARNMDSEVISGIDPQVDVADKPQNSELVSALNSGITPLSHDGTEVHIVRLVTNYHLDSAGNPDYAVLDAAKSLVPDFIADDLQGNFYSEFAGFKLDEDPEGTDLPDPGVATPLSIADWIFSRLKVYARGGAGPLLLSRVEELKDQIQVELDSAAAGRANAIIPLDVVEGFHQFAGDVRQIG